MTSYLKEQQNKTIFFSFGQNQFGTYISVGMFHFNKCHCNEAGGVVQRTRDSCLDQPVRSMEWQNSIKTASHQLQQYVCVRIEYTDHLIKEAIKV